MSALEQALGGPAIEVVAKATRRRFTVEYKRKIVREADGCRPRARSLTGSTNTRSTVTELPSLGRRSITGPVTWHARSPGRRRLIAAVAV